MSLIKTVVIENFRGFERVEIEMPPGNLAVFVGVNGAGKTALVDAIWYFLESTWKDDNKFKKNDTRIGVSILRIILNDKEISNIKYNDHFLMMKYLYNPNHHDDNSNKEIKLWFESEENIENQETKKLGKIFINQKIQQTRILSETFLSKLSGKKFTGLRIERSMTGTGFESTWIIDKNGTSLSIDQLSSGERSLFYMIAWMSRWLVQNTPEGADPLQTPGVVLIDEIDLHLHPRWQRNVLPALTETFPNLQFIITTHSPQVLSRVPNGCLFIIDDFKIYPATSRVYGRDSNSILHVLDTPERPEQAQQQIRALAGLIDGEDFPAARALLTELEAVLGEDDPDLVRLRLTLSLLEG